MTRQAVESHRHHDRYHLSIQTAPHEPRIIPQGWTADALADAREMAMRADAQWMDVRLIDAHTGRSVPYRRESARNRERKLARETTMYEPTQKQLHDWEAMGRKWAQQDAMRRPQEPNARWGNTVLDAAYDAELKRITGKECIR